MDTGGRSHIEDTRALDDTLEAPPIVRFDERRMHVRAYNYWTSLLGDRNLPSIEDLNPAEIEDFGSHSVLLDFTSGIDDPSIAFLGTAISAQCGIETPIDRVSQIPPRTLLSRLTDHYLQIIANAAPIGFEAEFTNQRGTDILYRGIMMPFSSDDDTIDFVYGVINWKEVASDSLTESIAAEVEASQLSLSHGAGQSVPSSVWADGPSLADYVGIGMIDDEDDDGELQLSSADMILQPEESDTLHDRLALARDAAAAATASEGRTRHAFYRAIGLAHAFALAADAQPDAYGALLADAGIEVQERSPLTALVKLVFGADYDKTRLAEFVCAIDYAFENGFPLGTLTDFLHQHPGGLKGLVAEVRAARRAGAPVRAVAPGGRARNRLARATAIAPEVVAVDESGLAVVVVRREADGSLSLVGALDAEDRLVGRVMAAAARTR